MTGLRAGARKCGREKRKPRAAWDHTARRWGLIGAFSFSEKLPLFRRATPLPSSVYFLRALPAPINKTPAPCRFSVFLHAYSYGGGGRGFPFVVPGQISRRTGVPAAKPAVSRRAPPRSRARAAAPLCAARRNVAGADPRDRETKSINFYWEIVGKKQKTFLQKIKKF